MNDHIPTSWLMKQNEFPHAGSISNKIVFFLRYAVLAPSAHNTQPWRFGVRGNVLSVFRDDNYTLKAGDPTLRQTYLGIGACIENFCISAEHWGYQAQIRFTSFLTSENPVAVIALSQKSVTKSTLFSSIVERHTNRGPYDSQKLPSLKKLSREKALGCAQSMIISDDDTKRTVADLVGQAMDIGLSMNAMKEELSHFVHSRARPSKTGMVIESMLKTEVKWGSKNLQPRQMIQNLSGLEQGQSWREKFRHSPAICCISSKLDGPTAWIDAGRLLQRTLLNAVSLGLSHDICAAPIEIPTIWPALRILTGSSSRPQALFRIGYALDPEMTFHSARRVANIS